MSHDPSEIIIGCWLSMFAVLYFIRKKKKVTNLYYYLTINYFCVINTLTKILKCINLNYMSHFNKENDDYFPAGGISLTGATDQCLKSSCVSIIVQQPPQNQHVWHLFTLIYKKTTTTVDYKNGLCRLLFTPKQSRIRTGPVKDQYIY